MLSYFKRSFQKQADERTRYTQLNIFYSFIIKFFAIGAGLLLVPLTLNYLTTTEYGIWITLNSILVWINSFDIGLGNGLRNKLIESFSLSDDRTSAQYVSTAYFAMTIVVFFIIVVFILFNNIIDWNEVLNIPSNLVPNISVIVLSSFICFCLTFVLKLISSILLAKQKAALDSFLVMLGQLLAVLIFFIFKDANVGDKLFFVAFSYSISPAIIYLVYYLIFFRGKNSYLLPRYRNVRRDFVKLLFNLGGQFFIIQISGLIIFSTASLLLANFFGPKAVTTYNIVFRYFNVVLLMFSVVLTPIWSATADAYIKNDTEWIKKSIRKIQYVLGAASIGLIIMVIFSKFILKLWVGEKIIIPTDLTIAFAIFTFVLISSSSYSSFLNGIGKLKIQVINIIIGGILFFPLTYFFCNHFGIVGMVYAQIIVNLSGLLLNIVQFNLVINEKAYGIWNK